MSFRRVLFKDNWKVRPDLIIEYSIGLNQKETQTRMRKTKKRLDKGKEARRLARSAAAPPAATKVVPDKRKKPEKHKKKWVQEGQ